MQLKSSAGRPLPRRPAIGSAGVPAGASSSTAAASSSPPPGVASISAAGVAFLHRGRGARRQLRGIARTRHGAGGGRALLSHRHRRAQQRKREQYGEDNEAGHERFLLRMERHEHPDGTGDSQGIVDGLSVKRLLVAAIAASAWAGIDAPRSLRLEGCPPRSPPHREPPRWRLTRTDAEAAPA